MAYEEASVAGETPDRSKQRKSSGNPTGAEPSVPAPAPEERDPRLAVAREVPAAREESSESSEREDQATAVFSTKGVASGPEERAESSAAPEPGDARLRAAVAAWVASADEEAPGAAETDAAGAEGATSDAGRASDAASSAGAVGDAVGSDGSDDAADAADEAAGSGESEAADQPAKANVSAGDADAADGSGEATASASADAAASASGPAGTAGSASAAVGSDEPAQADAAAREDGASGNAGDSRDAEAAVERVADAKPAKPKADAKPAEPTADAEPADPKPGAKRTELTADAEPVGPKADAKSTDPTADAKSAERKSDAKSAEPTADAEPASPMADTEPASPMADAKPASPMADAKPASPMADAKRAGSKADAKPVDSRADAERAESTADGAPADPGTDAKPAEPRSDAKPAEPGTEAKPADPRSDAKPADPKADAMSPGPAADAGRAEPKADVRPADPRADAKRAEPAADTEPKGGAKLTEPAADTESKADAKSADPTADAEPKPGAKSTEPKPGAKSTEPKPDAKSTESKPGAKPKADTAPSVAAAAAADKPSGGKTTGKAKTTGAPKAGAESDAESGTGDKPSDDAPTGGVDQATAVFKALSPKAVDQPTTMLKLGDHKPGAKKPEAKPEAKPAAKPEGDAERTSKFVALKPLDSAPKPPAATPPGAKAPAPEKATPEKANVGPERTTQQPLPPRPPLDLLAELTNTPPPPETPVRTAVRRVKIWTPLVLLLVVVFAVVQAVRPLPTPTLALTAKETVTFEGGKPSMPWPAKGQAAMDVNGIGTFGTSGDQKPVPIASIAKVMTVYLVLRDHPLKKGNPGPKIPVDAAAEKHYTTGKADNESVVKVTEGQKITQYEALQAVMLPSANNVAKLLARWDTKSDSEDEFVAKMNKTAKELGMKNTHYTDPSGLDKTTVSTAEDLVKLGRAAMEDPVFNEISRQPSYKDLNNDKQNNFFGLVPTVAIGIKTGTTTAAGGNILFAAEKKVGGETRTIIGAALGQYGQNGVANIDQVTGVTRKLIEAGQDELEAKTIVKKGDVVGQVDDGLGGTTPVVATKDVAAAGWSGLTVKLKLGEKAGVTIPHSAKAGTTVGVLSVGDGKEGAVEVPVALQKDLAEPGFGAKLQRVG